MCFALTSDYEGTPNVIMEALVSGLPVISTNVGDVSNIIENNVSGKILPSNTPTVISECIQELLIKPELRLAISKNGRERICNGYNTNSMVDRMIEFYKRIC